MDEQRLNETAAVIAEAVWNEMARLGAVPNDLRKREDAVLLLLAAAASSGVLAGIEWARRAPGTDPQ